MSHKLKANNTHFELRSREIQDLMGTIPPWVLGWGGSILLAVMVVLLALAYYIRIPEQIEASFKISSMIQPIQYVVKDKVMTGQIFVPNYSKVSVGDTLLQVHSYELKRKDYIISPADGIIVFTQDLTDARLINKNEALFRIIPPNPILTYQAFVEKDELSRILRGQHVSITIPEQGKNKKDVTVSGKITVILPINQEGLYPLTIKLERPIWQFLSTDHKSVTEIKGSCLISISDKSILERLMD